MMHLLNMRRSSTFCSLLNSFSASLGSSLSSESLDIKLKTFSPNTYYCMYNCRDKYSQGHPNKLLDTRFKPNTTKCVQQRTKYLDTRFKNSSPVLEDFIHNLTEGRNSVHSRLPSLDKQSFYWNVDKEKYWEGENQSHLQFFEVLQPKLLFSRWRCAPLDQ